eukprot:scaffold516_cov270-Pinguiococcus_pyrenoidosus.AAC.7
MDAQYQLRLSVAEALRREDVQLGPSSSRREGDFGYKSNRHGPLWIIAGYAVGMTAPDLAKEAGVRTSKH